VGGRRRRERDGIAPSRSPSTFSGGSGRRSGRYGRSRRSGRGGRGGGGGVAAGTGMEDDLAAGVGAAAATMAAASSPGDAAHADGKRDVTGGDAAMIAAGA
jgi:hypothetical protein